MAHRILPTLDAASELRDIHAAVCRARRQGLLCSTCADLAARALRLAAAA